VEKVSPKLAAKQKASQKLAAKEKPVLELAAKAEPRETEKSQITPLWKPMGLAPADKAFDLSHAGSDEEARCERLQRQDLVGTRPQQTGRGPAREHDSDVCHRTRRRTSIRARQQSSGSARLDQLALATVRNAAPFPSPPVLKDGPAAYTIRIDFH
jgi:hypothetical protein